MDIKKQLQDAAVEAVEEFGADDYTWNKWEKEDKKRIYISLKWYTKKGTLRGSFFRYSFVYQSIKY